ncbi:uncharacterized protein LY79DRAFT_564638 [Colletotrichum navitas]|uniref:Uncharacterized protein n=1 Tax=Colletotrichum navitas TaxID=681940 RepID=A0AAD8PRB0_9PEZI|nr:uncharacterized protein LY79DRAFT_564638 [Colletotrichum navitas]KAK1579191.1 hypothetical protein LY79DRAFT_564638 [Colletotrichum navitas]
MKITSLALGVLAMATCTLAADPKKHPGWQVPYENEPLPLHETPECMQRCMEEKNWKMGFDIYTVPRITFCRDEWDTFFTWFTYHVGFCSRPACGGADKDGNAKRNAAWMYKLCGFPRQSTVSGLEDWKTLPPEEYTEDME